MGCMDGAGPLAPKVGHVIFRGREAVAERLPAPFGVRPPLSRAVTSAEPLNAKIAKIG